MPDQPLPTDPHFGFYLDRDTGDESQLDRFPPGDDRPPVYPTRDSDYETREIERLSAENERLTAQLQRARDELALLYASHPVPTYMIIWLARLEAVLEME